MSKAAKTRIVSYICAGAIALGLWGYARSADLEDARRADEIFTVLMGEQVEPRKEWIERNAKYAINIDI